MALIKCPECKKKISNQSEHCPNCGYPIKSNTYKSESTEKTDLSQSDVTNHFFKKVWFWIIASVVLIALISATVLFINRDTKPKFDKDGNPVFVELTNEVYTNANKYKGYHIDIKGKVFQIISDNGTSKGIQIWLNPETCEQNLMIYYNTDVDIKQGDYISCTGYIDSVTKYKNAYNTELYVPLIYSSDLKKATYIDVVAPAFDTITPDNLQIDSHGYKVAVDKVEFSEKETRLYVSITNNGTATLCVGDCIIIQDGKQYKSTSNNDANYDEISYEIVKGASSTGIIVFPAISSQDFELSFDIHSDNYNERLNEYSFLIGKETSKVKEPKGPTDTISLENVKQEKYRYSIAIDKVEFFDEETLIFVTVTNNGDNALYIDTDNAIIVQNSHQYMPLTSFVAAYDELPHKIAKGAVTTGVVPFPKINTSEFELTLDIHSDDYEEELGEIVAKISKEKSEIITPWCEESEPVPAPIEPTYSSIVGTFQGTETNIGDVIATFYNDGTLYIDTSIGCFTGTWTQANDNAHFTLIDSTGSEWTSQDVVVSNEGIYGLWGEFYQRIG